MKDHEIARLVNELRDVAVQYKDTDQLRARIADILTPVLQEKQKPVKKKPRVRCVDGRFISVAKPPRNCAADRDGDCYHPGCPQRVDWQPICPIYAAQDED